MLSLSIVLLKASLRASLSDVSFYDEDVVCDPSLYGSQRQQKMMKKLKPSIEYLMLIISVFFLLITLTMSSCEERFVVRSRGGFCTFTAEAACQRVADCREAEGRYETETLNSEGLKELAVLVCEETYYQVCCEEKGVCSEKPNDITEATDAAHACHRAYHDFSCQLLLKEEEVPEACKTYYPVPYVEADDP
jgi:hypothetical protein